MAILKSIKLPPWVKKVYTSIRIYVTAYIYTLIMVTSIYAYAHGIDFKQRTNQSKHDVNCSGDTLFQFQSTNG